MWVWVKYVSIGSQGGQKAGFLSLGTIDTVGQMILSCRELSYAGTTLGLHSLDTSNISLIMTIKRVLRYCQMCNGVLGVPICNLCLRTKAMSPGWYYVLEDLQGLPSVGAWSWQVLLWYFLMLGYQFLSDCTKMWCYHYNNDRITTDPDRLP
jgi:hypothetical protein